MKAVSKEIILAAIFGVIISFTLRNWGKLPFVENSREKSHIQIINTHLDGNKNFSATIINENFNDISDVQLECNALGESGSKIDDFSFTAYTKINSNESKSVSEQIELDTTQASTFSCIPTDFKKLNSHKNKDIIEDSDITVEQIKNK